jgi:hypothetical protein
MCYKQKEMVFQFECVLIAAIGEECIGLVGILVKTAKKWDGAENMVISVKPLYMYYVQ